MSDLREPEGSNRQRPQYGEYASDAEPEAGVTPAPTDQTPANRSTLPDLPGVPHNLGVSGGVSGNVAPSVSAPQVPPAGQPEVPPAVPTAVPTAEPRNVPLNVPQDDTQSTPSAPAPVTTPALRSERNAKNLRTDRIFTIVLLVIGAFGALNLASAAMNLGRQLHQVASAAGLDNYTLPAATGVIESVATITILSIYAVFLLWSVHRLRNKRMAFWVPLVAAALAFIALTIFMGIVLMQSPELIENVTPENFDKIMQNLSR